MIRTKQETLQDEGGEGGVDEEERCAIFRLLLKPREGYFVIIEII